MKNHFICGYFGNKRDEVDKLYDIIKDNLKNVKTIIEPFCGTSAFSYYLSTKHPKKFKYILNDNNEFLMEIYNILKDEDKTTDFINKLNELHILCKGNKEEYVKADINKNCINWLYKHKYYSIRPNLYPTNRKPSDDIFNNIKNAPIINFLKNEVVEFSNLNALEVYEKHTKDKNALIFLDPPYIGMENNFYKTPDLNIYEYMVDNDIDKENAKILICINENWINKLIFKKHKITTYDKIYQTTKKKIKHMVITNKKIKII